MNLRDLEIQIAQAEAEYKQLVKDCNQILIPKRKSYLFNAIKDFKKEFADQERVIVEKDQLIKSTSKNKQNEVTLNKPNVNQIDSLYLLLFSLDIVGNTFKKIRYKLRVDASDSSHLNALVNISYSVSSDRERTLQMQLNDVESHIKRLKEWLLILEKDTFSLNLYLKNNKCNLAPFSSFSEAFNYIMHNHGDIF